MPMTAWDTIEWLRAHNTHVRFESGGQVAVTVNGYKRRRPTLAAAVHALREKFEPGLIAAELVSKAVR